MKGHFATAGANVVESLFSVVQLGRAFVLLNRIAAVDNDQLAGDVRG